MLRAQTARQEALRRCNSLIKNYGSSVALIDKLTEHGMTESWVRKFIWKYTTNPTIDKLDQLLAALDDIEAGDDGA